MFGITNNFGVSVCKDAAEAISKGFDYKDKGMKPIEIKQVVIVQKGTVLNNSTVDLLMEDEEGNKYVVLVTGRLLKTLPL